MNSLLDNINAIIDGIAASPVGHPGSGLYALLLSLIALLLILRSIRSTTRTGDDSELLKSGIMGKLARLEAALNDQRTQSMRSIESLRTELNALRSELGKEVAGTQIPLALVDGVTDAEESAEAIIPILKTEGEETETVSKRLVKTRQSFFQKLKGLFSSKSELDPEQLEELEELLISSDIGVQTTATLLDALRESISMGASYDEASLKEFLKDEVIGILDVDTDTPVAIKPVKHDGTPLVVLVVGVNGVGKTTTIAKLASAWKEEGAKVLVVAADTFRAAAVDQLEEWGARVGVPVIAGAPNARPQTVVFDAMQKAFSDSFDVVIVDTAGRLHTKTNLMQELEGISNIVKRYNQQGPDETLLVLDASTGQNALQQAKEFNVAAPLSGLIVTKLDGTAKGGVIIAIKKEIGVPIRYIGVGEGTKDLRVFSAREFAEALFLDESSSTSSGKVISAHAQTRREKRSQKAVGE